MDPVKVGEGAFGCGYYPPLSCEGERQQSKKISKLMPGTFAIEEKNVADALGVNHIDPDEKYFISDPRICSADKAQLSRLRGAQRCNLQNFSLAVPDLDTILLYNYGGESLVSRNVKDVLSGIPNIMQGLILLKRNRICHADVKLNNIVMNDDGTCRLIDFGMSYKYPDITMQKVGNIFKGVYFVHPVESIGIDSAAWPTDIPAARKRINEYMIKNTILWNILDNITPGHDVRGNVVFYQRTFDHLMHLSKEERVILVSEYLDVYSLGVTIADILSEEVLHRTGLPIALNPRCRPLIELIKQMINPDISARISLENSLTEYIRIMTEIFKVIGPGSIATRTGILFPMNIPLTPRPIAPPIVPPRPIAPPGILSPEYMHRIARPVAPVVAPIGASIRFPIDVTIEHFRKIKPDIVAPVSVVVRPPIVLSPEYMHKIAGPMPVTIRTIVRKSPSLRSSGSPPV